MLKDIIGFFDDTSKAVIAKKEILNLGVVDSDIQLLSQDQSTPATTSRGSNDKDNESFMDKVKHFFTGLGDDDSDTNHYAEGVRRGGATLKVTVDDSRVDEVAEVLNDCGAVDTDRRANYYKESGINLTQPPYSKEQRLADQERYNNWENTRSSNLDNEEEVIPVIEEKVNVGKRIVDKGNVRIYTHVAEMPINESINLKDERVDVERRAVNRPVQSFDMNAFKEGEINLKETAEEAVVDKEARVVEEVRVRKDTQERTENINETAKRTDVKVDRDNETFEEDNLNH